VKRLTVYHGTDTAYETVKLGNWVTLSKREAIGYAEASLLKGRSTVHWLLQLEIAPEEVEWIDGEGQAEFDGKHGRLLVDAKVCVSYPYPEDEDEGQTL